MSAARTLGFVYLAMATVFGLAIALQQHPQWQRSAQISVDAVAGNVRYAAAEVIRPAAARTFIGLSRSLQLALRPVPSANSDAKHVATRRTRAPAALARIFDERAARSLHRALEKRLPEILPRKRENLEIAADSGDSAAPAETMALAAPQPGASETSASAPPQSEDLAERASRSVQPPTSLDLVLQRLKENLSPEMLANFDLFLYVSKAERGPWAQHMYVFAKAESGDLDLKYNWLVSTGREKVEFNDAGVRLPSFTPQGYFELDPVRMYRRYMSSQWHQPMPFAMFFNWLKQGSKTGLAIHAASGEDVGLLGKRASAGCIRLSPENASTLFELVKSRYRGLAPSFAVDRRTGTMSSEGILLHEPDGRVKLSDGYKVLIFIENYGGAENVMAALY
ncbi:MAG: L,D-transpeptidase [Alphaproteobacteria bacterium]|nr:L,D-transpeptidase [Alphaproteobacteria bacterium]